MITLKAELELRTLSNAYFYRDVSVMNLFTDLQSSYNTFQKVVGILKICDLRNLFVCFRWHLWTVDVIW